MIGDFNAHSPQWDIKRRRNPTGKTIEEVLDSFEVGILNSPEIPTYIDNRTGTTSCLDLCITSKNLFFFGELERDLDLGSDHFPIRCTFGFAGSKSDLATAKRWKMKLGNWKEFGKKLAECENSERDWVAPADANMYNREVTKAIIDAAEACVPQTSGVRSCRRATPWWDNECIDAVAHRREAKNRLWSRPTIANLIEHRKQQATAKHIILKKKKETWSEFVSSIGCETPLGKVWNAIKSINGKQTTRNYPVGDPNTTNERKAELFLDQYTSFIGHRVEGSLQREMELVADSLSLNNLSTVDPISKHEVQTAIALSKNTSPGEDRVSNVFLKKAPDNILEMMTSCFNTSLYSGQVPEDWKIGITCPIPKPGKDLSLTGSYRPITMLSCIGKVMERIIQRRLEHYLETNRVFPPTQSAYRKGRGTSDSLALLTHHIHSGLDRKEFTIVVYLDLEGAYDRVWHNGLISKMMNLKINNYYTYWVKNYLKDRFIKVRVGSCVSEKRPLPQGVPQGAVISPCLFNIMLHDIPTHPDIKTVIYADDITLACSARDIHTAKRMMQNYLRTLTEWMENSKFNVNPRKCSYQIFTRARIIPNISIRVSNQNIAQTQYQRVLGVRFDAPKLTFHSHIDYLKEICRDRLPVLRALSSTHWGSSREALRRVYISFIRSRIEYGCIIFKDFPKKYIQKLNVIQNTALRCILGARKTSPITSLEVEAYIMPLELRFKYLFMRWYIKTIYGPHGEGVDELAQITTLLPCTPANNSLFAAKARTILQDMRMPHIKQVSSPLVSPVHPSVNMNEFVSTEVQEASQRREISVAEVQHVLHNRYNGFTEIYTDGSKLENGDTAAAMYVPSLEFTSTWKLNSDHTVLGAELFGILMATEFVLSNLIGNQQKFVILTDSQVSLHLIKNIQNPKYRTVVFAIQRNIVLSRCIELQWVRGHFGLRGNEIADRAAHLGHSNDRSAITVLCLEEIFTVMNRCMRSLWQREWKNKVNQTQTGQFFSNIFEFPDYRPWLISGTRRIDCVTARLRIGHVGVGSHLHRFNMKDNNMCSDCGTVDTIEHFLLSCNKYTQCRSSMQTQLQALGVPLNLKCILGGGLFNAKTQKGIIKLLIVFLRATAKIDEL